MRAIVGLGLMGAIVAVLSCAGGQSAGGDCPFGTFRPVGFQDCVIPADSNATAADNRCASGAANSPTCESSTGGRPYYATSTHCAPGYQYKMGSCLSGNGDITGSAGAVGTAGATGAGGDTIGMAGTTLGTAGSMGGLMGVDGVPLPMDAMSEAMDASTSDARDASMSDARDASMSEPRDASDVSAGSRDD